MSRCIRSSLCVKSLIDSCRSEVPDNKRQLLMGETTHLERYLVAYPQPLWQSEIALAGEEPAALIARYRRLLKAAETHSTRLQRAQWALKLARLLLHGSLGLAYEMPSLGSIGAVNHGNGQADIICTPQNRHEEVLLLLLIVSAVKPSALLLYDLLPLATLRWPALRPLLAAQLQCALPHAGSDGQAYHFWQQHALSLLMAGQWAAALRQLQELMQLDPHQALPFLLAARLCYQSLEQPQLGLNYALQALQLGHARAQLYVGLGQQCLGRNAEALATLEAAVRADDCDHLSEYYLARQHALLQQPEELLALLLSGGTRRVEALCVVKDALAEYPDDLQLLRLQVQLELRSEEPSTALVTAHRMLSVWQRVQSEDAQAPLNIWLLLAEIYLELDNAEEALHCIKEAESETTRFSSLSQSAAVLLMRGRWHLYASECVKARRWLNDALALNPKSAQALRFLAETQLRLQMPQLAEQLLQRALQLDGNCPELWFSLALAKQALGENSASVACLVRSLELQPLHPVLPFTELPLVFE
ncbi:tetratricopeptide repeat protein 7B-like [Scaptodrosophila lebanonensis]|uniref:Tetratricopeptide repeat protein 7B-like n=1 Tax=Drosophila lebanonensis TaxID=7225 RepID=A0A6J2U116_DROLE|nr:tetratricopeptide repeat protein 7B-like [Scaptodrosophila lebanonensis]